MPELSGGHSSSHSGGHSGDNAAVGRDQKHTLQCVRKEVADSGDDGG